MEGNKSNTKMFLIIGVIAVVIIAAIVGWQVMGQNETAQMPTNTQNGQFADSPSLSQTSGEYMDGTYTASGNYQSPAQLEEVEITLTIAGGVVTDAEFVSKAVHPTSKMMQGKFSEGFEEAVVGKNIDQINLTVVNGSSLTPKGFMDALSKIKTQAHS